MVRKFTCPECGATFWSTAGDGWGSGTVGTFESVGSAAGVVPEDVELYERSRPVQVPDVHGHFVTPFFQAMATGLAAFVLVGVASVVWRLSFWLPFLVGPGVFALAWLLLLVHFNRLLVDRELVRPRSPEPVERSRLRIDITESKSDGRSRMQIGELPLDEQRLGVLARSVVGGQELTFQRWTGAGKLLSRGEMKELQEWLVRCGLARWKNPDRHQEGLEFSAGGQRFWARLAAGEYDVG